jgi:hypothetical protein
LVHAVVNANIGSGSTIMQSWSGSGQNGTDGHNTWQANYEFAPQNGQYDPNQTWSQPMVDGGQAYSHLDAQGTASPNFFDPSQQASSFLSGNLQNDSTEQSQFHHGQAQQYQPEQAVEASFHDMPQNIYNQPGNKMNVGNGIGQVPHSQGHPHAHSRAYVQQHDYAFAPQPQYSQAQLLQQQAQHQNQAPTQTFEEIRGNYAGQEQGFARAHQPSPVQHQQTYQRSGYPTPINSAQLDSSASHAMYQQQHPQQAYNPQTQAFIQPSAQLYQQPSFVSPGQVGVPHQSGTPPQSQYSILGLAPTGSESGQPESTPKKRKRAPIQESTGTSTTTTVTEPTQPADVPVDASGKNADNIDSFDVPVPSPEDVQAMAQFAKRSKAAQARQPAIKGLPHLVYDGSIKLPGKCFRLLQRHCAKLS